jgi:hypothetical protein
MGCDFFHATLGSRRDAVLMDASINLRKHWVLALISSLDRCSEPLADHLIVLAQNSSKVQINGAAADLHYLIALRTGKVT